MGEVMSSLAEKIFMPSGVGVLDAMATRRAIIFAMVLVFIDVLLKEIQRLCLKLQQEIFLIALVLVI